MTALIVQLVVALAITAVGVVGLATERQEETLGDLTQEAIKKANTYRFSMKQQLSGRAAPTGGVFDVSGSWNETRGIGRIVTTINLPGSPVKCTSLYTKDHYYVQVHPSRRESTGAAWVRADAKSTAQGLGFRPDELYSRGKELYENLDEKGTKVIRGVKTTRYTGTHDVDALGDAVGPLRSAAPDLKSIPVEVYIDDDHLLRRMIMTITTRGIRATMTMEWFDYGASVNLKKPAPAETKPAEGQEAFLACYPNTFPAY